MYSANSYATVPLNNYSRTLDVLGYIGCITLVSYVAYRWGTGFFDPYLQNDDTRTTIFPFWSMHNGYFQNDFIAHAMGAFSPWLHNMFYYVLTFGFDLLTVTKLVQIVSMAWGSYHLFRIGHRRAGGLGGLLCLYLVLHTHVILDRAAGGLPRAFAFPVILMAVDGIDSDSDWQTGIGTVLGFALYPPAGLISLTVYYIWLLSRVVREKPQGQLLRLALAKPLTVTILCFLSIAPSLLSSGDHGKIHSLEQARSMPEFGRTGRLYVIPLPKATDVILESLAKMTISSGDSPLKLAEDFNRETKGLPFYLLMCLALFLVALGVPPSGRFIFLYVAISGIILFGLANLFAFRLYSPERMILFSLPVAVLCLFASTFTAIGHATSGGIIPRISSFITTLVFIAFFGVAFSGPVGLTVNAHSEKDLFRLLQSLPENALFSGHPLRINNIPLWAKRRILVSYETSQPWLDKSWNEIRERINDAFEAYYASTPEPLRILRKKYGVDYMLVHELDVTPLYYQHCVYFDPFNERLKTLCRKPSNQLIWTKTSPTSVIGRASGYLIIDLKDFLRQQPHQP